jgi:hypothetical protein
MHLDGEINTTAIPDSLSLPPVHPTDSQHTRPASISCLACSCPWLLLTLSLIELTA